MQLQSAIRALFPPRCVFCGVDTDSDFGLCGACWREVPFIDGLVCDACGQPLPGLDPGEPVHCDECLARPRPWERGRAAFNYEGTLRRLVLAFKHGDRADLARPLARWMAARARPLADSRTLVAPVPLNRTRLLRRRYNQAALLARGVAHENGGKYAPDLLIRTRQTRPQEDMTPAQRRANQQGAFAVPPARQRLVAGRGVLLVDDVMTSCATLEACAHAVLDAGAVSVNVLVLARVAANT